MIQTLNREQFSLVGGFLGGGTKQVGVGWVGCGGGSSDSSCSLVSHNVFFFFFCEKFTSMNGTIC